MISTVVPSRNRLVGLDRPVLSSSLDSCDTRLNVGHFGMSGLVQSLS